MILSSARTLLPTRTTRLRFLAHTRHIVGVMLPLGAAVGLLVALALYCLAHFEPWVQSVGWRTRLTLLLPAVGLFLTTIWLRFTGLGEVSLGADLDLARTDPYGAFPFLRSLGKVVGCALTIGFGGSAGTEGPGKWFGAAMGLQYHRVLRTSANYLGIVRRLARPPLVMARAGAASALAAVFRAPLSGALMAAENHGHLAAESLIPCLVSAASGYVVFSGLMGYEPLLPLPRGIPTLRARELFWALGLGLLCGLASTAYLRAKRALDGLLRKSPLVWRGLAAGVGLSLLAVPGHFLFSDLPITEGGGLDLVKVLLQGGTLPGHAMAFLGLKLAATALTFAGGGIGGLWLPSLTMGCALGTAFDGFAHLGTHGYLTLVGGAAMAGATNESLLVPVVFLAETTGQAALVVPALVATTVSYVVVREGG
ncbi:chloride channel protein [Mesoterricola silvestris]|uniref:Chloride channel protein n=1 Tax=Mesoterricola silvestris TaxID=2927979 RepID=A0AA48K985_9BACT|nr:chloride channel protein [Mesoterricola silvestris]BDU72860.1 hypothetical protein METEAL_20340 [Mesoterricola silvestris]